jgi:hypothetical protein
MGCQRRRHYLQYLQFLLVSGADGGGRFGGLAGEEFGHAFHGTREAGDGGEIGGLAHQDESAEGFPDVILIGGKLEEGIAGADGGGFRTEQGAGFAGDGGADFSFADTRDERPGIDVLTGMEAVVHGAGGRRGNGERGEHGIELGAGGGVAKSGESESGVAADHRLGITDEAKESGVEGRVTGILAHDPRRGLAQFDGGAEGLADDVGIPAGDVGAAGEALAELNEGMLGVAGMGGIGEISGELGVGEFAAEPGFVPEEEREQDKQESEEGDEEVGFLAGGQLTKL